MVASLLFAAVIAAAAPADAARINAIDVGDDSITLRFDDRVASASAFLVGEPERLAVDVAGIESAAAGTPDGPVTRIRSRQIDASTARVVFDLAAPATIAGGRFANDGRSLTLDLKAAATPEFDRAARAGRRSFGTPMALTGSSRPSRPAAAPQVASASDAAPSPRIEGSSRDRTKPLVVIDAGHGGHDPGSLSLDGTRHEKDATLAIAKAVRDELLKSHRVRVALTRSDDRFLVLDDRREIARKLGADLFISIHADSAPSSAASGATVYTLSEVASDRVAARLAAKENRADVINGVNLGGEANDVSSILIDLTQRETMNVSSAFATLLQHEMPANVQFRSVYHQFAGFVVLKAPDVPSVLLETGYMTNPQDIEKLFSKDYQHDIAVGVRRAVEVHFARRLASQQIASAD